MDECYVYISLCIQVYLLPYKDEIIIPFAFNNFLVTFFLLSDDDCLLRTCKVEADCGDKLYTGEELFLSCLYLALVCMCACMSQQWNEWFETERFFLHLCEKGVTSFWFILNGDCLFHIKRLLVDCEYRWISLKWNKRYFIIFIYFLK